MQSAPLPATKQVRPEYHDVHVQVVQDVLHRLDKACAALFRRLQAGEHPGYPRYQGRDRYNSLTYPQVSAHGGAVVDGGMLSLTKIGRIRLLLHRSLHGTPTARPRRPHGTPTARPRRPHGTPTARPRRPHGTPTARPRHAQDGHHQP
jgi:hypothetical protein